MMASKHLAGERRRWVAWGLIQVLLHGRKQGALTLRFCIDAPLVYFRVMPLSPAQEYEEYEQEGDCSFCLSSRMVPTRERFLALCELLRLDPAYMVSACQALRRYLAIMVGDTTSPWGILPCVHPLDQLQAFVTVALRGAKTAWPVAPLFHGALA